jgi:hypothetical protein
VPIPDTTIVGAPPSQTSARTAVFEFAAAGAPSKGFECSVDSGAFVACKSPADFGHLSPGAHLFTVRALSSKGDADQSPATYRWTVFEDLVPEQQQHTTPRAEPKPKQTPPPQATPPQAQQPPTIVG